MKVVFSHTYNSYATYNTKEYLEFTALSNYFAQKQGFETIFFGDDNSIKDFKKIKFNFTEKFSPEIFNKSFPKCFWASGKLIASRMMSEPFIHVDNDLFITKPLPNKFLNSDLLCLHDEIFANVYFEQLQALFIIKPEMSNSFPTISYNCGIFGGQDFKTIHKSIDILFEFITNNSQYIDLIHNKYIRREEYKKILHTPVLIEQIWLFQIFKYFKKNITTLFHIENFGESLENKMRKSGCLHLMTHKIYFREKIKQFLIDKKIEY